MIGERDGKRPGLRAKAGAEASDNVNVLLVNDDPATLFSLRTVLGDLDATVVTAASGQEALLLLLHQDFVVILLDVKMAGMDGFETARLIRGRARSRATPLVFLTSHRATDLDRTMGYNLGAADYLFMPVAPEVLKAKVRVFIDLERTRRRQMESDGECVVLNLALRRERERADTLHCALQAEVAARTQAESCQRRDSPERLIIQHAGDYVALLDPAGCWTFASPSYDTEFGNAIRMGGCYLDIVHPDDREHIVAELACIAQGAGRARLQYRVLGESDYHFETEATLVPGLDGAPDSLVMVSRDVTERKQLEAYVLHQSLHDSLTGLPNRLLLEDRLGRATSQRERPAGSLAVLFIDLDRFKEINDSVGHAAGDRLLQDVAERLGTCMRDGDTVARLGGDEFVVLLLDLHAVNDAALVADKILRAVGAPCWIEGKQLCVTPSIGIAVYPDDGTRPDTLLRNADTAMYNAKHEGRGRFAFFTPLMQEAVSRRLQLGSALQRAIDDDEFVLHYQPKVNAVSGAVCGAEALIRWTQRDGKPIPPSIFIPVAEETGRIDPIGSWALQEAVAELARWRTRGVTDTPIAVNISPLQFRRTNVAGFIEAVVSRAAIDPGLLEVELTESGVMSDPATAIEALQRISAQGIAIAIDDFGTGYSSLAYLKRLPIDKLKIDASFVRDIATDPSDGAIVRAIITLAHVLNMTVVAEGVETAAQVEFLMAHACDELQGNYFSEPVSGDAMLELLARGPFILPQTGPRAVPCPLDSGTAHAALAHRRPV
ncbi:EAL domain-containing protein [Massilia antarctica]|uniref:EAL domain-containing protein n=1 Tax=Massilia antarctica TaxID=2765360 RepID=A0AA48WEI0_9BURK|nr:EAL domain-containing protein [Massilia antarctica]QPI49810.1 EAL domain-containing protein [Massilia antarctica]